MKRMLFYVTCYHHRRNEWARLLLAVPFSDDPDAMRRDAERGALDNLESAGFVVRSIIEVCQTEDPVFIEV